MSRPVEILVAHLRGRLRVPAHVHAVDHAADQREEAEDQEYDAQYPVKQIGVGIDESWLAVVGAKEQRCSPDIDGLIELHHNHKAQRDENEPQVEQQHQAADALHVRAEGIRR